jgi:hypothetical protein
LTEVDRNDSYLASIIEKEDLADFDGDKNEYVKLIQFMMDK